MGRFPSRRDPPTGCHERPGTSTSRGAARCAPLGEASIAPTWEFIGCIGREKTVADHRKLPRRLVSYTCPGPPIMRPITGDVYALQPHLSDISHSVARGAGQAEGKRKAGARHSSTAKGMLAVSGGRPRSCD